MRYTWKQISLREYKKNSLIFLNRIYTYADATYVLLNTYAVKVLIHVNYNITLNLDNQRAFT